MACFTVPSCSLLLAAIITSLTYYNLLPYLGYACYQAELLGGCRTELLPVCHSTFPNCFFSVLSVTRLLPHGSAPLTTAHMGQEALPATPSAVTTNAG